MRVTTSLVLRDVSTALAFLLVPVLRLIAGPGATSKEVRDELLTEPRESHWYHFWRGFAWFAMLCFFAFSSMALEVASDVVGLELLSGASDVVFFCALPALVMVLLFAVRAGITGAKWYTAGRRSLPGVLLRSTSLDLISAVFISAILAV